MKIQIESYCKFLIKNVTLSSNCQLIHVQQGNLYSIILNLLNVLNVLKHCLYIFKYFSKLHVKIPRKEMFFFINNLSGASYLYCRLKSRGKISSNHAIVITGCGSGLGYSLALHCRELGATVVAGVLQMDCPGAKRLESEDVLVYPLDITLVNSVKNFTNSVRTILTERNLSKSSFATISRLWLR